MTLRSPASVKAFRRPLRTKSSNFLEPRFGPFPPRCRFFRDQIKAGSRSGKLWRLALRKQPLTGWAVVEAHAPSAVLPLCPQQEGLTARLGCGQVRQDGGCRGRTPAHPLRKCASAPALLLSEFQY